MMDTKPLLGILKIMHFNIFSEMGNEGFSHMENERVIAERNDGF